MKKTTNSIIMYSKQTNSVLVTVTPTYQDSRSSPFENMFVWTYHIRIENKGSHTLQLLNRHWKVIDALGQMKEITGSGVVGVQPSLEPGEDFEYTSETSLTTSSGMMFGIYEMATKAGEIFNIDIPAFSLDCPHIKESMN